MDHLLGSDHPAGVPAHAVRHHRENDPAAARMRHDGGAVLLFAAIALMLGNAGIN